MPAKKYFPRDNVFKYFFVMLFVALGLLALWVAKPFLNAILASSVIAYVFYPLYKWLNKRIKSRHVCAAIVSLLIVSLIVIPLFFIIETAAPDARYAYIRAKQRILTGEIVQVKCPAGSESLICKVSEGLQETVQQPDVQFYLRDTVGRLTDFAIRKTSDMVLALPMIFLNIFVTFFVIFYLLMDGEKLTQNIKRLLPIKKQHQEHIFKKLQDTTHAVIFGSLVIAIIQGTVGGLGFWFFGIKSPLLWGIVMAFFALVPFVGTAVIWLPAGLILIAAASTTGNIPGVWKGIALLAYGTIIISGIDNVLKPVLIGGRAKVHPVLVLVGVLGGLVVFGFAGFIIGPIILAAFNSFIEVYQKEYMETKW